MNLDNMKIDTEVIKEENEKIKKAKTRLEEILKEIKDGNNDLKNHWESNTSESVFQNFEDLYKDFDIILNNLEQDIDFLNKIIEGYNEYERKANQEIDEKIAG